MSKEFLRVITPDEAISQLQRLSRLPAERMPLDAAVGRIASSDVVSPEALPDGHRATMDGYAVRAADTFGASDLLPALLRVVGAVEMGALPEFRIGPGEAAAIPTGGYLPEGADAVVMIEETTPADAAGVEIHKPVTVGESVLRRGDDIAAGSMILPAGTMLRPSHAALLAALGICEVAVFRRPRVAIVSTGNEVVPLDAQPKAGQIRDANAHGVAALAAEAGGIPSPCGIVADDFAALRAAIEHRLGETEVIALSGGSSVGQRDLVVEVAASIPGVTIIAHGLAIAPGKPTLLARFDGTLLIGLPGQPASALIVAAVILQPFVRYLAGGVMQKGPVGRRVRARLAASIPSVHGREDYVRVRLDATSDPPAATPLFGRSSMLSTLAQADGLVMVPIHTEGLSRGETVDVALF
jgi:molybdopterin molybdotransferase